MSVKPSKLLDFKIFYNSDQISEKELIEAIDRLKGVSGYIKNY